MLLPEPFVWKSTNFPTNSSYTYKQSGKTKSFPVKLSIYIPRQFTLIQRHETCLPQKTTSSWWFQPFLQKYAWSKWVHLSQKRVNIKNIFETTNWITQINPRPPSDIPKSPQAHLVPRWRCSLSMEVLSLPLRQVSEGSGGKGSIPFNKEKHI